MSLTTNGSKQVYRHFYRQFIRAGHKALGLTGLHTKVYTNALRRRFSQPQTSSLDHETWRPRLENTLQLIMNAVSREQQRAPHFETILLLKLVHYEYNVQKLARMGLISPNCLSVSSSSSPSSFSSPSYKAPVENALNSYAVLVNDLNRTMNMCL